MFSYTLSPNRRRYHKDTGKNLPILPYYSQICRRVNKLAISNMRSDDNRDNDDKDTIIAVDSTVVSR